MTKYRLVPYIRVEVLEEDELFTSISEAEREKEELDLVSGKETIYVIEPVSIS